MNINILETGAVSDGTTLNTQSIQRAIDLCAQSGGGRVEIPAGCFLTGSIWLKSHVELYLEQGAVLKASTNMEDYNELDAYPQNYSWMKEGWVGKHLIIAVNQTDIAISGHGTIDGSAEAFFEPLNNNYPRTYVWSYGHSRELDKEAGRPGQLVVFAECDHIRLTDITIQNTPCWSCFLHGCDHVWIRGLHVQNPPHHGNSDGLDIDTCRYVTVSDCIMDTGDDAIAIRCASKRLVAERDSCEHITISNCVLATCSSAFRFGVGSGTIRNINISNINIVRASVGFNLMTAYLKRGNVNIENVHITNVFADQTSFPFRLTENNDCYIRNISIDGYRANCFCNNRIQADEPGSISNVTIKNAEFTMTEPPFPLREDEAQERGTVALVLHNARKIRFADLTINIPQAQAHKWDKLFEVTDCEDIAITGCNFA